MSYLRVLMTALLIFVLISPRMVYAYIDPGTGSLMIQVLIGALIGGFFAVKMFWKRIKVFFKGLFLTGSKHEKAEN